MYNYINNDGNRITIHDGIGGFIELLDMTQIGIETIEKNFGVKLPKNLMWVAKSKLTKEEPKIIVRHIDYVTGVLDFARKNVIVELSRFYGDLDESKVKNLFLKNGFSQLRGKKTSDYMLRIYKTGRYAEYIP